MIASDDNDLAIMRHPKARYFRGRELFPSQAFDGITPNLSDMHRRPSLDYESPYDSMKMPDGGSAPPGWGRLPRSRLLHVRFACSRSSDLFGIEAVHFRRNGRQVVFDSEMAGFKTVYLCVAASTGQHLRDPALAVSDTIILLAEDCHLALVLKQLCEGRFLENRLPRP